MASFDAMSCERRDDAVRDHWPLVCTKVWKEPCVRGVATAIASRYALDLRIVMLAARQKAVIGVEAALPRQARVAIDANVPLADCMRSVTKGCQCVADGTKLWWQAHASPCLNDAIL